MIHAFIMELSYLEYINIQSSDSALTRVLYSNIIYGQYNIVIAFVMLRYPLQERSFKK